MFKELLLKKMLMQRLKGLPPQERDRIIKAIEDNPDLFATIAQEADVKTKNGMNQMDAAKQVFEKHQDELRRILGQ